MTARQLKDWLTTIPDEAVIEVTVDTKDAGEWTPMTIQTIQAVLRPETLRTIALKPAAGIDTLVPAKRKIGRPKKRAAA